MESHICAVCKKRCCNSTLLDEDELKAITEYLKDFKTNLVKTPVPGLYLTKKGEDCCFLSPSGCVLPSSLKPKFCSLFPFMICWYEGNPYGLALRIDCPHGMVWWSRRIEIDEAFQRMRQKYPEYFEKLKHMQFGI